MWSLVYTKKFLLQYMELGKNARDFVYGWVDYILIGDEITDDFEYDIVDEYDGTDEVAGQLPH